MDYEFSRRWAHLKAYIVQVSGEASALSKLRAAAKYRLESCNPETLTLSYLHYQILGDVYQGIAGQAMRSEPPRWSREPDEPKIEKGILLGLVTDRSVGLDILERQIETNAQEYIMGTRNAVVAPVLSPPVVHQARSSETGYQTTSASSPAFAPPQQSSPQRGLADSPWGPGTMVATNTQARQSQAPVPETRNPASVTAQYPALPGTQPPNPTPGQPKLVTLSQAQAVPAVAPQSLQQKVQRELEAKVSLLTKKMTEPQSMGAGPWQILLPPSVEPMASIKPYQRVLEEILGVDLVIKYDRLEIGQSNFHMAGRPEPVRAAVRIKRRMSAYTDLAAYVKFSRDTGVAPDIVDFLLARQVDAITKLKNEQAELGATRQVILASKVAAPNTGGDNAPRNKNTSAGGGRAPGRNNTTAGGGNAPDKNKTTPQGAKPPDSDTQSSQTDVQGPPPPTTTTLPDPKVKPTQGETKQIKKEEKKQDLQRCIQHRSTEVWQAAVKPLNFDVTEVFGEENVGKWKRAVHEIVTEIMEERLNWDKLPGRLETAILQRYTFDRVIGRRYTGALDLTKNIAHMVAPPRDHAMSKRYSSSMSELLKRLRDNHETCERAAELPEESETVVVQGPPLKPQVEGPVGGVPRTKWVDTLSTRPKQPAGGADEGASNEAAEEESEDAVEEGEGEDFGSEVGAALKGEGKGSWSQLESEDSGSEEGAALKKKGKGSSVKPKNKKVPSRAKSQKTNRRRAGGGELRIRAVTHTLYLQARAAFGPSKSGHEETHARAPTFPMPRPTDRSPGAVELTSTAPLESRPHRPPRAADSPAAYQRRGQSSKAVTRGGALGELASHAESRVPAPARRAGGKVAASVIRIICGAQARARRITPDAERRFGGRRI
ncbi:hypothetical protein DL771_006714 [Monosporascus sp. 5C6A]|nr:hypothetical protein DL771_006714 [Monosporascus sp. 5C6A]